MNVTITYCVPCRYERRAHEAAEAILDQLGVPVSLVGGGGGVFRVDVDGAVILSRTKDYFPTTDDVVAAVRERLWPDPETDRSAMSLFICGTCGTQYPESSTPPPECAVCIDERQYVGWRGQEWITREQLTKQHTITIGDDQGVLALAVEPDFAIAHRAIVAQTTDCNLLWECLSLVTDDAVAAVKAVGGVQAIAISHPHFYTSMLDWSDALGGIPIYLHEADREWVRRPSPRIEFWSGRRHQVSEQLTLVHCPGHFPGSTVLHLAHGPHGGPALLSGDSIQVAADRRHVSFMYSYPNQIPLARSKALRIQELLSPYEFDDVYGYNWGRNIIGGGRAAVDASFARYVAALEL